MWIVRIMYMACDGDIRQIQHIFISSSGLDVAYRSAADRRSHLACVLPKRLLRVKYAAFAPFPRTSAPNPNSVLNKISPGYVRAYLGHFRCPYNHADQWVRLPAWGFLVVFHGNHGPKMHGF